MKPRASIIGIGTATPEGRVNQVESLRLARTIAGMPALEISTAETASSAGSTGETRPADSLERLYRRTTVRERGSVLFSRANGHPSSQTFYGPADDGARGPSTAERLARYAAESPALAERSALAALADAGVRPSAITHLVTVSCTGFVAPGLDVRLIRDLDLPSTVGRTHVGFMGCHGALNGLRVAEAVALADGPAARVLVVALELCSLHFQYDPDPGQSIANALFADGAGAAVVACGGNGTDLRGAMQLAGFASNIIPETTEDMTWTVGDHGFRMTLSRRVPDLLRQHLRPWLEAALKERGLSLDQVRSYAVHPGGPKIVDAVGDALGLQADLLAPSREVLTEHGNMSSPTVFFILERLRSMGAPRPTLALAFGPGVVAEAMLLD